MKILKEWAEMVADKIRGYHIHKASGLVCVSFRGDWVMHENGYIARTSAVQWDLPSESVSSRSEDLEKLVTNIASFSSSDSLIGISKDKIYLVKWFESERQARITAEYINKKKVWNCKSKKWI